VVWCGWCRMQADRLSAGQHPHHPHHHHHQQQQQSMDQSARSVTTIMFPPVSEQVQASMATSSAAPANASGGTSTARDHRSSSSSAFLLTKFVHLCRHCKHCVQSRVYETVWCPSVYLSQHWTTCCGPRRHEISISCCSHGGQVWVRASASSATL